MFPDINNVFISFIVSIYMVAIVISTAIACKKQKILQIFRKILITVLFLYFSVELGLCNYFCNR